MAPLTQHASRPPALAALAIALPAAFAPAQTNSQSPAQIQPSPPAVAWLHLAPAPDPTPQTASTAPILTPDQHALLTHLGLTVRVQSRWLHAVSVQGDHAALDLAQGLPFVDRLTPIPPSAPVPTPSEPDNSFGPRNHGPQGRSEAYLRQTQITDLQAMGVSGQGIRIAVLDTGFRLDHLALTDNEFGNAIDLAASFDFISNDPVVTPEPSDHPDQHRHGTMVLGVLAADLAGGLMGAAPDATYLLAKTKSVTGSPDEDLMVAGLEWAHAHNAHVALVYLGPTTYPQSSLDGNTTIPTLAANLAAARGISVVTFVGNAPHDASPATSRLSAPGDAPLALTVGGIDFFDATWPNSSDGPTADARVKPELLARAANVWTLHPDDPEAFLRVNGTEYAAAIAAGAAACIRQLWPSWSPSDVRQRLIDSARSAPLPPPFDPLYVRGHGIINAWDAATPCPADINRSGGIADIDDVLAFFDAFNAGDARADLDRSSGVPDIDDILAFFNAFNLGC